MAKILIVEDNQGTNKAICEYMKEAGHTLFSAFTGSEALKIFREKELDIIVLDIMLPEMSGIVVLHEIRKISNIPVIMLTALDDEYTQSNSFDEMADDLATDINNLYQSLLLTIRNLELEKEKVSLAEKEKIDFLRTASHELKTPVTELNATLENMILGIGEYRDYETYLPKCKEITEQLGDMIRDILNASRLQTQGNNEPCSNFSLRALLTE